MAHKILNLNLGNKSYPIEIGSKNSFDFIRSKINEKKHHRFFLITDEKIASFYLDKIKSSFPEIEIYCLPEGEKTKSFSELEKLISFLLKSKISRDDCLIAFGGGVVGDITGFAASIILRGVSFIQIPTTLLAQVDSSVGGKTGINSSYGKNLIGSFYQPKAVCIDVSYISTLSDRHVKAGYAEILKHGIIMDSDFFEWLDHNAQKLLDKDQGVLIEAIYKSCSIKSHIVELDEKETKGIRAFLNFGHTFAHAIETEMNYEGIYHGEAVSIGMCLASEFSSLIGNCQKSDFQKIYDHHKKHNLNSSLTFLKDKRKKPSKDIAQRLISHMQKDKKVEQGNVMFILLKKIGEVCKTPIDNQDMLLDFLIRKLDEVTI